MSNNVKILAATAGVGAVLAMGALGMATSSQAEPSTPGPVPTETATIGQTTVETSTAATAAPTTPTTSSATPQITGPAPLPSEEQGLPG